MRTSIYTIFDSSRCVGEEELPDIFEDYFDLESNDIPVFESDDYWQFNELVNCTESELFWEELNRSQLNAKGQVFIVTGTIGWYNKEHKYTPRVTKGIENAVQLCSESGYMDSIEVQFCEGAMLITTHHHDGCNRFEVRRLSDKGISKAKERIASRKAIPNYPSWYKPLQLNEIDF